MSEKYCDHCGEPVSAAGSHGRCRTARVMEPPRYCAACGRRMVVQVTPRGWVARCARHGTRTSYGPDAPEVAGTAEAAGGPAGSGASGPAETAPDRR